MPPVAHPPPLLELHRPTGWPRTSTTGKGVHTLIAEQTLRAVLGGLGVDASTPEAVADSLVKAADGPWRRTLPATVVCREGWTPWVRAHVPHGSSVRLTVELEDGGTRDVDQVERWVHPRVIDGREVGEATFELPGDLPTGWHRLVAHLDAAPVAVGTDASTLVVTPGRLELPETLRHGGVTGLMTQIYQVRSARCWGIGDLGDLGDLASWAATDLGAEFVLINPLHAAEPVAPMEPSPYLPSTPASSTDLPARRGHPRGRAPRRRRPDPPRGAHHVGAALNTSDTIDRDACWAAKREALAIVHTVGLEGRRARDFERFREREGEGLATFATWCALAERHGLPWSQWPSEYHDPTGPAVAEFARSHEDLVRFHLWLQWLLDRQLGEVQRDATAAGMSAAVIHDLAVGVSPRGADSWGLAGALALGVTVGAPPDQFNRWGRTGRSTLAPDRLAEPATAFSRHGAHGPARLRGRARRHVIGLFRLWWIRRGDPGRRAYVTYDHEALIGILPGPSAPEPSSSARTSGSCPPTPATTSTSAAFSARASCGSDHRRAPRPARALRELCLSSSRHTPAATAGFLVSSTGHPGASRAPHPPGRGGARGEERSIATGATPSSPEGGWSPERGAVGEEAMHRWLGHTPARCSRSHSPTRSATAGRSTSRHREEYPNWRLPLKGRTARSSRWRTPWKPSWPTSSSGRRRRVTTVPTDRVRRARRPRDDIRPRTAPGPDLHSYERADAVCHRHRDQPSDDVAPHGRPRGCTAQPRAQPARQEQGDEHRDHRDRDAQANSHEQDREQRHEGPDRERGERRVCRMPRFGERGGVDPELGLGVGHRARRAR